MRIAVIDVSNKVQLYDAALCKAIYDAKRDEDTFVYLSPSNSYTKDHTWYKPLISLVPKSLTYKYTPLRKIIKCIESLINYFVIITYLRKNRIDIAHFQWFPFLDYSSLEVIILKMIKKICPDLKIFFTDHNIIPHDLSVAAKKKYILRFAKIAVLIDRFIVHTESSKRDLQNIFDVHENSIDVVHHGIFKTNYTPTHKSIDYRCIKITMFGTQSYYKGTDLFIDAISKLPKEQRQNIQPIIIGPTAESFYKQYCDKANLNNIIWIKNWVTMDELQVAIDNSDIIVLPYRSISQSGVLLQALYFKKLIITSDLDSFKETLVGFPDEFFFESENSDSLKVLIEKYLNNAVDIDIQYKIIDGLNELYKWSSSAKKTLQLYSKIISQK